MNHNQLREIQMNPTRSYMRARAAAIVAQLEDQSPEHADVDHRVALRIEYVDLRAAMLAVSGFKVVTRGVPHPDESLWAEHCQMLGLPLDHTAATI